MKTRLEKYEAGKEERMIWVNANGGVVNGHGKWGHKIAVWNDYLAGLKYQLIKSGKLARDADPEITLDWDVCARIYGEIK